jgi:glucokinase
MIYAGIDLGGTTIKGALVNEKGQILRAKSIPTGGERPHREVVLDMAHLVEALAKEQGIDPAEIESIGIGSPGSIDPIGGRILFAGNFADFRNVPMVSIMQEVLPQAKIYLENDANVAALGESMFGAGRGSKNVVMITIGTGLGGGVIINGKIFSGAYYGGAELGHQVIVVDGEACTCGRKGCWEAYSSATALIRMAKEAAALHTESVMNAKIDTLNAKDVFDAEANGDTAAKEALQKYYRYLAIGLANTINVFQPEYLIIGGGPSAQGDKLLQPVMEELRQEIFGGNLVTKVVIAEMGNDAGVVGAAMLGRA